MPLKRLQAATVVRLELVAVFVLVGFLLGACTMVIHERAAIEAERKYYQAQRLMLQADQSARCSISLRDLADRCRCDVLIK